MGITAPPEKPNWAEKRGAQTTTADGTVWTNVGKCPMRPELPEPPPMMRKLPIDKRGYPVPWFVDWVNGEPEFRAMDPHKLKAAILERLCWVCGNPLWNEKVFTIGPMCAVNRISSEPPSHRECAQYSARNCPFLSRPHMHRRTDGLSEEIRHNAAGIMIDRNPGVTLLWFTLRYEIVRVPAIKAVGAGAGILFKLGRAFKTEWYSQGRPATRAEVLEAIDSGLPLLQEANRKQGIEDDTLLNIALTQAKRLIPEN